MPFRQSVYALPNVVAPAHPDPLTRARIELFDDEPAMIVDVCRCGDATPEDGICVGGAKGLGRRKRHQGAVVAMAVVRRMLTMNVLSGKPASVRN